MATPDHTRALVAAAAAIAVGVIAASLIAAGSDAAGWLYAARYTARWSYLVFLAAFLGPVVLRGFGGTNTRAAILAFGAVHGIHLGAMVTYRVIAGQPPEGIALAIGGLAYGLIAILVVAEFFWKSGPVLRAIALHYAWLVFVLTYASRLNALETRWVGIVGVGTGIVALVIRSVLSIRARMRRHAGEDAHAPVD